MDFHAIPPGYDDLLPASKIFLKICSNNHTKSNARRLIRKDHMLEPDSSPVSMHPGNLVVEYVTRLSIRRSADALLCQCLARPRLRYFRFEALFEEVLQSGCSWAKGHFPCLRCEIAAATVVTQLRSQHLDLD